MDMSLSRNVLYYGSETDLPERIPLRAGPLSLWYENGDLRYLRLGDREILRRVYVAVRDRAWGTVPPRISNLQLNRTTDTFHITYNVDNRESGIDFFWRGTISGDARGTVTFKMDGVAHTTFLRNRIGFCVLHPVRECAGMACRVEHVDGTVEQGSFPRYISPHQPLFDMRAISHQVAPGVWAEVRFEGDTFEMEDQRNWTDASYKTYCTPLALPFPVEIEAGTTVRQSVTLTLKGGVPKLSARPDADVTFAVGDPPTGDSPAGPLPRIGLGVASHGQPLSQQALERLRALHLSHLRVDLDLVRSDYEDALRRASTEACALDVSLEITLTLSDTAEDELAAFVKALERAKPPVGTWLIFHRREPSTGAQWVRLARRHLAGYDPAAKIGAGTNIYFTELNRQRPPVAELDLVSYSLNPQVHAFDNASLAETLATQAETVESARQFTGNVPLAVSPVTLKPRFTPHVTGPERQRPAGELPPAVDVRQMSLFGAGWTAGSLKYLAESGVCSVTYYETTGWRGVMETEAGSPLPDKFRSLPGAVFPLYHVLADVGEFDGEVIPTTSSHTLRVDGIAVRQGDRARVILANLTAAPQRVIVQNLGAQTWVRALDETNAEDAMVSPEAFRAQPSEMQQTISGALELELLPHAIIRLDCERKEIK